MKVNKSDRPNEGIKCIVNSCHYYASGDHCTAEKIQIEPKNAADSQETDCATFIQKQ